ncbi:low affinity immunoglobulin gamma Fc region receptor II-like isoform X2 [Scomber scombrus]|uniref:low affinity immunoglobulin gamma Fc region receptor II-like isoform X2 n=1 Tax=Scomber scombrus TaxID=13677 RepID=UPI002DD923F0|nr:low affinity immunoglobulin gamma Fc region receptor II-like isoform X2 [Scomber scombrus]
MEVTATLIINPDRTQFFRYEYISLSCATPGNSSNWTVKRTTSSRSLVSCGDKFGRLNGSICTIRGVYTADSGHYWCESERGERSNVIDIIVNNGVVILESPALPVREGDTVTLRCSYKERYAENSTSDFPAKFHKPDGLILLQPTGQMSFQVTESHEGLYKCEHPTKGQSPQSFLVVRKVQSTNPPPTLPSPLMTTPRLVCTILLIVLYNAILIVCIIIYRRWARGRAREKKRASHHLQR